MSNEHIETVIIGAGQAGLATGYHLKRLGRPFVILDGNPRVGDNWRSHWDTLRLYTPAKYDGLPGMRFPGDRWSFPQKDEVAAFLESYAIEWDLPVRTGTRVRSLEQQPSGAFEVALEDGTITCDNVVVATGTFGRTPYVPEFAADLDPTIRQMHSAEYQRPSQLQPGPVLVVGASHSGMDIAYELSEHHETILCGRDCGAIPVRLESRRGRLFLPVMVFVFRHLLTRRTPMGRKEMNEVRFHGGPSLRVKPSDLAQRHVARVTDRVTGVADGRPVLGDGRAVDVRNVVWSTGFQQVFDWVRLPILDENGWPREYRGVAEDVDGLFFCGLSFQYAFASMVFPGVGRDAAYVARRIAARASSSRGTGSPGSAKSRSRAA
jgi:putative flavoprotein involved in K+ transport